MRTFTVPTDVIKRTITFLRRVGAHGCEGFVLWSGELIDTEQFGIRTVIVPDQYALNTDEGLLVTVDGKTLFDVNRKVHERGEILAVQVHSHPTEAYHSSTDDTFPLVTIVGGLSVVIPEFARQAPRDIDRWAWYRLSTNGTWDPARENTEIEIT